TGAPAPILLVDNDEDDVELLIQAFRQANLANAVRVAADGDQAVAYLSGEGQFANRSAFPLPVLILLDIKMPRRTGHEVLQWLREQDGLRRIPVAMLSSSREREDVDRAYDLGANAYLVKPVDFEALLGLVRTLNLF